jgi:L-asparaginase II
VSSVRRGTDGAARGVPVPLVEVTRSDLSATGGPREVVESVHLGHLVAVDGDGAPTHVAGDADVVVFPRSALKPLQATICLELIDEAAGGPLSSEELSSEELAVGWGSHLAEPHHLAAVRAILARAGVHEDALSCPAASVPGDATAARHPVHHNCSGKHAMFALTARALGLPGERDALLAPGGPLQTRILGRMADLLGPARAVGVDGCGAPALAMPLVVVARAFARLAVDARFARVRDAGLAHPELIAGHERGPGGARLPLVDTALLAAGVVAKRGAEGVLAAGWRTPDGRTGGAAVKASDGSLRGAATALVDLLEREGVAPVDVWREPAPRGGGGEAGTVRAVTSTVLELR